MGRLEEYYNMSITTTGQVAEDPALEILKPFACDACLAGDHETHDFTGGQCACPCH